MTHDTFIDILQTYNPEKYLKIIGLDNLEFYLGSYLNTLSLSVDHTTLSNEFSVKNFIKYYEKHCLNIESMPISNPFSTTKSNVTGNTWFDIQSNQLFIFDGNNWIPVSSK